MRVIGGTLKGRIFSPEKNFRSRPTTDMAKESLFNILANIIDFEEIKALDLFSGTGSISYELASRGCKNILSIENDFYHYKFIIKCIEELNLQQIIKPIKQDVFAFLQREEFSDFDLIFADPPFDLSNIKLLPQLILNSSLLKKDGLLIIEHGSEHNFSNIQFFWQVRHYGKVFFSFFKLT